MYSRDIIFYCKKLTQWKLDTDFKMLLNMLAVNYYFIIFFVYMVDGSVTVTFIQKQS